MSLALIKDIFPSLRCASRTLIQHSLTPPADEATVHTKSHRQPEERRWDRQRAHRRRDLGSLLEHEGLRPFAPDATGPAVPDPAGSGPEPVRGGVPSIYHGTCS
jgi:hypothetical protein